MEPKVFVLDTYEDYFFAVKTSNDSYFSSEMISELLNLDIDEYNEILTEKVIQHENVDVNPKTKDLVFLRNRTTKETYIKRFKEVFAPQLMLIKMGGWENDKG